MEAVVLTIESLAGGGAVELFHRELDRVLANIQDPNTEAKEVRAVILQLRIKPTQDRESGVVSVQCRSKLAPPQPLVNQVFMGRRDGKLVAVTHDPKQSTLFDQGSSDVVPITREGRR